MNGVRRAPKASTSQLPRAARPRDHSQSPRRHQDPVGARGTDPWQSAWSRAARRFARPAAPAPAPPPGRGPAAGQNQRTLDCRGECRAAEPGHPHSADQGRDLRPLMRRDGRSVTSASNRSAGMASIVGWPPRADSIASRQSAETITRQRDGEISHPQRGGESAAGRCTCSRRPLARGGPVACEEQQPTAPLDGRSARRGRVHHARAPGDHAHTQVLGWPTSSRRPSHRDGLVTRSQISDAALDDPHRQRCRVFTHQAEHRAHADVVQRVGQRPIQRARLEPGADHEAIPVRSRAGRIRPNARHLGRGRQLASDDVAESHRRPDRGSGTRVGNRGPGIRAVAGRVEAGNRPERGSCRQDLARAALTRSPPLVASAPDITSTA